MPDFSAFAAAVFDLDGTLLDSLRMWNAVDQELWLALGGGEKDAAELCRMREESLTRHCREANPYLGWCADVCRMIPSCGLSPEEIHARRYAISREFVSARVEVRPGADRVVKLLRKAGQKTAIATTTRRRNIDLYADVNPLVRTKLRIREDFDAVVAFEDVRHIKPDPEAYLTAAQKLGLPPEQCLAVEDSLPGAQSALAAGMTLVVIDEPAARAVRGELQSLAHAWFPDHAQFETALRASGVGS